MMTMTGVKFIFAPTTEEGIEIELLVPDGLVITEEEFKALKAKSVDEVKLLLVVGTHVNDLLVTSTDDSRVSQLFADTTVLELKDLGNQSNALGMRVPYGDLSGNQFA
ncbi:uncharacterized protein PITG_02896 [Phytophthora infestans T30-4]|uniref:Uncharacterized protein n=2 Tax=Phytophthora infestans TaxID=4787 RepID=D0MXG0_PHYIT|nr:uncharacterized protein PITG_02896 [Phytophthora infestans T30-4]EEY64323.1 hypothetical protein PITG_02896 [Phytophthora infestans T30-4]|eukprot:XP_002907759.1 hypothetical protein PITG_02896 [Phytophthora infestans T30-4]